MGERDYPNVMSGKLHLDPEFQTTPSPPVGPEQPHAPSGESHIDMGVSEHPSRPLTGGLPPSLDPTLMGPVFGHFGPDDSLESQVNRDLQLPSKLFGHDDRNPAQKGWGKNGAGAGTTWHGYEIGGKPTMSTSDRMDNPDTRARADRQDQDTTDAQQRGEKAPDPVGDAVKGPGGTP